MNQTLTQTWQGTTFELLIQFLKEDENIDDIKQHISRVHTNEKISKCMTLRSNRKSIIRSNIIDGFFFSSVK